MDNTLSVCMIVKDEEKVISNCLQSIKHIADEIIVVDTGSTDDTIEIAKQYDAKIIKYIWNDDFSDARNKSLECATKNWILVLDADERIDYDEALLLKKMLLDYKNHEGFIMKLVNIEDGKKDGSSSVFRLFKNNPKYRFSGKIHEQIVPSMKKTCKKLEIGSCNISILHVGYDSKIVNLEQKAERNLRILNNYKEDEKDGYYYYSLGNEYVRIKDHEKAIYLYNKGLILAKEKDISDIYVPYLYINLIKTLFSLEKYIDSINVINECEKQFEGFKDLYLFKFLSYFKCGYYSKSKIYLDKYLNINNKSKEYPIVNLDTILDTSLENIIKSINQNISQQRKDLLSIIIISDTKQKGIEKTIISANEISNEVIVISSKNSNLIKDKLTNLGAKVIESDYKDNKEIFLNGVKYVNNDFILLLKPSEIIPSKYNKSLPLFLEQTSDNYYNIQIIDSQTNVKSNEFRLYRNNEFLKNMKHFADYINFIEQQTIIDCSLYIEKVYDNIPKGLRDYVENA
ncbi:MAG: glycosyltransferase [Paraclostridium sp.]